MNLPQNQRWQKKTNEKYMEENELLKPIYSNFVEYKNEFNKDLISSGALETIKNFSNIKEIIEKLNNLDVNKPEELNETINNIVEKFVSLNISNEIKRIMEFNSQLSNAIKDLNEYIKKDINSSSLETYIKKVKETIHSNIYNISMFINEYKNLSSKIEEIKNILSSLNNTKLISTTIENIQTLQKNINSNIQKSIEKLLEIIENNNNAGKKRVEDLKNLMNNTVLFSGLKPILDQLDGIYSDYSINKNEIIEKIKEIIQINISNIINNNTEFKEELNHKREELNKYLLSLKDKYISNIKNTSKIENMIKSFDESVRKQSDIINNRFNLTRIIKELNQTLDKEAKDNKLLEIAINLNTNIEKFINIIRNHDDIDKKKLEEVLQNITQNIKNSQVLISQKMNESLYSCNNEWIDNLINDENLQKVVDDFKDIYLKINFTYNKENIKKYLDMFINDIDNITKSILEDNDLKKDLNKLKEYLNKTKKNIENIDYIKKFLDNINIIRNRLNDLSKNIAELLKESLNASKILSSFNDIDKIQKFINKSKVEILSDYLSTFQNIEEKVLLNLNESLSKLFEMNYENIYEKIKDFNISEIKIQLNNSICKYKQKIIEISNLLEPLKGMINGTNILNELKEFAEKQNLYQLFNKSKDNIIDYIKKNMNSSTLNEKIVEDLDNVLTKLINYSIKNMDIYEFIFKDSNGIKHRIDDILNIFEKNKDELKIAFKNITKQNKVLEKMMTKIIEDLFNSTKEIENFKNLNISEIFFNSVNNSNLKEMIEYIESIFDQIKNFTLIFESDNITKAILEQKEDLEKTISKLKNKIQTLNNTNLNKEIERLEELNNKIFKKLNESETRKIIENFIKNIKQLKNNNKVFIYEIINNITERLNKANVTEISNILINLIQSNNRIIKYLENITYIETIFNEFKEQMKKNNTNEDIKDKINSLKKSIEKYHQDIKGRKDYSKIKKIYDKVINDYLEELKDYKYDIYQIKEIIQMDLMIVIETLFKKLIKKMIREKE